MKQFIFVFFILTTLFEVNAQTKSSMQTKIIRTQIGKVATHLKVGNSNEIPIIFLHGVYFDHNLWKYQIAEINDRTVIAIDMPFHGQSKEITKIDWNLNDCAEMLIEILDSLQIPKVIAVGHSWGSMTIIRATEKNENRFHKILLCNMPFTELDEQGKRNIRLQHMAMVFRKFYMKQAGKLLYGKQILADKPDLLKELTNPMSKLTNKEIKLTDKKVRIDAINTSEIIRKVKVLTTAIIGKEDYVGKPPLENIIEVEGGHTSPLEVPEKVTEQILKMIKEN